MISIYATVLVTKGSCLPVVNVVCYMVETSNQKQSFPLCVHLVKYIDGVVLAHRDKQAENNTERRQRWMEKDREKEKIVTMSTSSDLFHYL